MILCIQHLLVCLLSRVLLYLFCGRSTRFLSLWSTRPSPPPSLLPPTSSHSEHLPLPNPGTPIVHSIMYSKSRAPLSSRSLNIQANSTTNDASSSSSEVTRHHPRSTKFPHRLNFYSHPPTEEITVEEFEEWAIDRLRCTFPPAHSPLSSTRRVFLTRAPLPHPPTVLADIEHAQQRNKPFEDIKTLVLERMKKYLPMNHNSAKTVDVETERKKDHYSHFVLRLAFCRS